MTMSANCRVLVIDDDTECAGELAELLESYGCETGVAATLSQARDVAEALQPHCAIVDVVMGPDSGIDLALEWAAEGRESPRVVLLSGRALNAAELARFDGPPPPMLLKPADISRLLTLIGIG